MSFTESAGASACRAERGADRRPDRATLRALGKSVALAGAGWLLAACSPSPLPGGSPPSAPLGAGTGEARSAAPAAAPRGDAGPGPSPRDAGGPRTLATSLAGPTPRDWDAYRRRAAHRLVEASPEGSYLGPVQEPLLGIPVLQVDLHVDGSVQRIVVLRHAREARDTSRLAEEAVRRAAPFGAVGHLPKPWRFTETFLFDEQRRFKPRSLDE